MTAPFTTRGNDLEEKIRSLENAQRATLNILEDFNEEKTRLETSSRATVNILEDFGEEKARFEETQRATLNILDDFNFERARLEDTQRALLNLLNDFDAEKTELRDMPRALQNILEDLETEKAKVEVAYRQLTSEILERKRAEETTRRLNEELEQRAQELEATNKELEAFTYSVAHDLRAPLRQIDGFARLLVEETQAGLGEEPQRHLHHICEGVRRMGQLVDDLLNLARVGRQEVRSQVTGLGSVVAEVLRDLEREKSGRAIEWKIQPLPFVECDPALMKQVFVNLLSNAVKFTRMRERTVIEIGVTKDNGIPVIFVRDNGVGFSMKYADKLFGVFQRLHRQEDFEGTGVGLATVQRIIHKHGGQVWAEAELDKGATFFFTLATTSNPKSATQEITGGKP